MIRRRRKRRLLSDAEMEGDSVKIPLMQYFRTGYLCRRRHKVALIAEQNLTFCSRSFDAMRLRNGDLYGKSFYRQCQKGTG